MRTFFPWRPAMILYDGHYITCVGLVASEWFLRFGSLVVARLADCDDAAATKLSQRYEKSRAKSYSNCLVYQISFLKRPDSAWLLSAIFSVALGGSKTCSIGVWEIFFVCVFPFGVGYQKVLQCLAQTRCYCQSLQKVEHPHPTFRKWFPRTKLLTKNREQEMSSLRWEVWPNWGAKLKSKTRDWTEFPPGTKDAALKG